MGNALISIARILVSVAAGGLVAYFWNSWRPMDEQMVAIGAGLVVAVMCFILLHKLGGSGGGE